MTMSGRVYIPRYKLGIIMKETKDKSSVKYQRLAWDALRKSINGLVNKLSPSNIKSIVRELFEEDLIRGRGLFCRSCLKSQMASPGFTDVFAALVSVVNTKIPEIGDLLLRRILLQFKRAFKNNDKPPLVAAVKFIAHLVNQQMVSDDIALELFIFLLEKPTADSVEVAVGLARECGSFLLENSPMILNIVFEIFRGILHEGEMDTRSQFLIEGLFALRRAKFVGYPAVRPELDLVDQEDQLIHHVSLLDEVEEESSLDIFRPDPLFVENEEKYEKLKKQILGEESVEEAEVVDDEEEDEGEEEMVKVKDETETDLVNLKRAIYSTIMSSARYEEEGHKLLKMKLRNGEEMKLCAMILECCKQERLYRESYGLVGGTFCKMSRIYQESFEKCFMEEYSIVHLLETNKLDNVARFFAHLLAQEALPWHVLGYIRLTEEDTTSSSRIFIKSLFQGLSDRLGIHLLDQKLSRPEIQDSLASSIFPKGHPRNTRFAINFFTAIGLGGITRKLRDYLDSSGKKRGRESGFSRGEKRRRRE